MAQDVVRAIAEVANAPFLQHPTRDELNHLQHLKQLSKTTEKRLTSLRYDVLRHGVQLAGSTIISFQDACLQDNPRLRDIKRVFMRNRVAAYWVAGSLNLGCSSAVVLWSDKDKWVTQTSKLGRFVGDADDAELYAIASALGLAKRVIMHGQRLEIVRVYSSSRFLPQRILDGTLRHIGPMIVEKFEITAFYERAQWLQDHDIKVESRWAKGGDASQGIAKAVKAAKEAAQPGRITSATLEGKKVAWGDEWTWRANAGFWNHWNDTARRDLVKQCMYEATCEEKMEDTKAKSGDTGDPVSLQEQYDDAEFDILEMECTLTGCTDDAQLVEYGKELQELKGKLKDLEKKLAGAG